MKKIISLAISFCLLLTFFAGCRKKDDNKAAVYYLNFKPEQDSAWQKLAQQYTAEKGVEVKVVTAAQGTYEQTLTAEIDKTNAPTLFQISGMSTLDAWKNYCYDLANTEVYAQLTSDDFALKEGNKVYGVAYVYEGYGIIVNKKLLRDAGYSIEAINSYNSLKNVAEDITKRSKQLGFSAFTSAGLDSSSSWRFSGHLANMPLFYEFRDKNITTQPAEIEGKYLDAYKKIWDLYIKNSPSNASTLTAVTGDKSLAEFTESKAVFYQNGTWEYSQVSSIGDDNIGLIPIYTGIDDDKQGICCGTENYWVVNAKSSEQDIKATLDFLSWVVTSETGTKALAKEMGFLSPFKSAKPVENVLCNIMNDYVNKGYYNVSWDFNMTPNVEVWRADVVSALAAYSAGTGKWEDVKKAFVEGWKRNYEAAKR